MRLRAVSIHNIFCIEVMLLPPLLKGSYLELSSEEMEVSAGLSHEKASLRCGVTDDTGHWLEDC